MTLNEYQSKAQRSSNDHDKVLNGILGLVGEAGEVADLNKKCLFQGHPLTEDRSTEELGDVLWYCAELASGLGVTPDDVAQRNIDKLIKRCGLAERGISTMCEYWGT